MARPKQRNGPPRSKGIHTTPSIRSASVAIFIDDLFCMLPVLQFLHSGSVVTMGVHLAKLAGSCSDERKQLVSMMLAVFDEQGYVDVPSLLSDLQLGGLAFVRVVYFVDILGFGVCFFRNKKGPCWNRHWPH